jgi:hypothetical protein
MGRPNKITSPEHLWELFQAYKKKTKENPFIVKDFVGKDAEMVYREKERPLTIEGFENYCAGLNERICSEGTFYMISCPMKLVQLSL